jgi:hypothetical protein
MEKKKTNFCVKNCDQIKFGNNNFLCTLYDQNLEFNHDLESVTVLRCKECVTDEIIGSNTDQEKARKLKKLLGYMADSFYSHKDEFEDAMTEMYRIIRTMEEGSNDEEVRILKTTSDG